MPVDSEVAKERIWKEHCEKMVVQSLKFRAEGRSHAEFTLNPYHLQHNKPVTDPVSVRSPDFLDRSKAQLAALSTRLTATGLSPRNGTSDHQESSPRLVAKVNKSRAVQGNNIFGVLNASPESKRRLLEEWSEMLNEELGGVKTFRESFLPPIHSPSKSPLLTNQSPHHGKDVAEISTKIAGSPLKKSLDSSSSPDKRDAVIQELLMRSSKPPNLKYEKPLTESQVLGWEAHRAPRPDPMFHFSHKSCEMTRFAAESGHSPTKKTSS